MNPLDIISEFYPPGSKACKILVEHSRKVTGKALEIAGSLPRLTPDLDFIHEAGMLHDIGIFKTNAPGIGCFGQNPYIAHGYLGRIILEKKGLLRHGLVCERHVGVGLTKKEVEAQKLPLPLRDMVPISVEEKIICFADKFFSKGSGMNEKSFSDVIRILNGYGKDQAVRFMSYAKLFGLEVGAEP